MNLRDYLKNNRLIADGSMGTYYSNLVGSPGAYSEQANLTSPEVIEDIHREYLTAGAQLLRTNTFAANRFSLMLTVEERKELVLSACYIAKRAAMTDEGTKEQQKPVWILGDIGPIPEDAGSEDEEILQEYKDICDSFIEEKLDGIHLETFAGLKYIRSLVPYIREKNNIIFLMASFSLNKNGYTADGISASRLLEQLKTIEGIDAFGFNCGVGSGHMLQLLRKLTFPDDKFIYVAPNAGYPEQMQNRMVFMDNEIYFAENMKKIAELGIDIIGGCCGTTPDYVRRMVRSIDFKNSTRKRIRTGDLSGDSNLKEAYNEFYSIFDSGRKVIAVELDPPYDAEADNIMECAHSLKAMAGIDIITFADSPMGRSRVDSILMGAKIAAETGMQVMPHVCCRDKNMISMRAGLLGAYIHGVRNLLLVTGDPVPGESRVSTTGVFDYNSIRLMDYVKEMNVEHFAKEPIYYGGALNYNRGTVDMVVKRMKQKIAAGAKYFLTQPVYSKEDGERLREIKGKVDTKILCGILPFVSYRNACFIKNEITGINVPDEIINRYHPDMSREEAEIVAGEVANEIIDMTKDFADGYYFMLPFNRVSLISRINRL